MTQRPSQAELDKIATAVREHLSVPRQNEVFRVAVEAGYLAATTDGTLDDSERKAIVAAIDVLSKGAVIEWEAEGLVEECASSSGKADDRAKALGAKLKDLGQPEAGLLFGAYVARATHGIDKKEEKILKAIAKAAGVTDKRAKEILKMVGQECPSSVPIRDYFIPRFFTKKAHASAASSMSFAVGFPAP